MCLMIFPFIYIILVSDDGIASKIQGNYWDYGTVFFFDIPALMFVALSFGFPIWKSYAREFRVSNQDETKSKTALSTKSHHSSLAEVQKDFNIILKDSEGIELFQKFLQREWSVENLLFWKAAEEYRSKFDARTAEESMLLAKKMFAEFVTPDAPLCVNLPYKIRMDITQKVDGMEPITRDFFSSAQEEIFNLMLKDSFRRFVFRDDTGYKEFKAARPLVETHQNEEAGKLNSEINPTRVTVNPVAVSAATEP